MAKQIPLSGGKHYATVDDADFERLNQHRWSANAKNNTVYAQRKMRQPDGSFTTVQMHREIARFYFSDAKLIDHIDGNGLNNQISNLRPATSSQNLANRSVVRSNTGYIGVTWREERMKHEANIQYRGIQHKAFFDDVIEAARWRDQMALELHGEFAVLNFPPDGPTKLRVPDERPKKRERPTNSPYLGVHTKGDGYLVAQIGVNNVMIHLGVGGDAERLARLRDCAVIAVNGGKRTRQLNFDRESYTDQEIQAMKSLIDEKLAANRASTARTVTMTLGVSYRVKAA